MCEKVDFAPSKEAHIEQGFDGRGTGEGIVEILPPIAGKCCFPAAL